MKITSGLFEAHLKCPTKCWLRFNDEPAAGNAYAEWARTKNESYHADAVQRLRDEMPLHDYAVGPAPDTLKSAEWRFAMDVAVQTENQYTLISAVERSPSEGRGKAAQFVPIRFIFTNKLSKDEKLMLAFDALALSDKIGRQITLAKVIHGDDHATQIIKTPALAGQVRKRLEKITALLAAPSPPDLVLNRHCAECEFQIRCNGKAIEKDDLSLIPNLAEKERTNFNSKGIFTVTQLSYTFRPRRRPKGQKEKRERYHHALKALALREKKIHTIGSPQLKLDGTAVYFDVEGLPDREFYYLIGIRIQTGDALVCHSFWADCPSDEGRIWEEFLGKLTEINNPVLIHYGRFESIFLKRMRERYGKLLNDSGTTKVCESSINLLSIIFAQIYFPTYSNGLKEIARWLGFNWSARDASGVQSIIWRHEWEHTKAPFFKEQLIRYNSEDCAALELVAHVLLQACQPRDRSNSEQTNGLDVIVADELNSRATMWPKFASSIEGFEAINRAARWDYQRNRIYIRTDKLLRRTKGREKDCAERTSRVSKTVVCEPSRICPRCQRKGTKVPRKITKLLHDLRFNQHGINGWVVKYQFEVSWCPRCREFTPWPNVFWGRTIFGRNVAAFAVYETIELCVTQASVTKTLNRLFGFQLNENNVGRFKQRAADYYKGTRSRILAEMVKGKLISEVDPKN